MNQKVQKKEIGMLHAFEFSDQHLSETKQAN